jgi:transcriptional regulator with XRE-family HTH domain
MDEARKGARERVGNRYPIPDEQVPHLLALGKEVRRLREVAGMSRRTVAERALCRPATLSRIERGTRRTRRSTLQRLLAAMVDEDDVAELLEELCQIAGPGLAPESPYAARLDRRRLRRARLKAKRDRYAAALLPELEKQLRQEAERAQRRYLAYLRRSRAGRPW